MDRYPPIKNLTLLFLIIIAGYLFTLNPALYRNDSPETIVGCMTLGVTHPPGYPLFNLLGKLFYVPVGNPAFSYNFLAALLGAFGCCLLYVNIWILIGKEIGNTSNSARQLGAFIAALSLAFSNGFWGDSIAAKGGVYILQVILELGLFLALQIFIEQRPKNLLPIFFLYAIGLTNHWPTEFLLTPALLITLLLIRSDKKRNPSDPKPILMATITLIVLSLYLYLPLRANNYPPINFDAPINIKTLITSISRTEYTKIEFAGNTYQGLSQTIMPKSVYISGHLLAEFHITAYFLIIIGLFRLWLKNRHITLFLLLILSTTIISNLIYLNVEPIEYWHMDDHLLSSNWIFGVLIGLGVYQMLIFFERSNGHKYRLVLVFTLVVAPLTFFSNFKNNDQKDRFLYYGYGISTLQAMPKDTLFFAESDYDYFSLLYLKAALKKRPDTHLVLMPFLSKPNEVQTLRRTDPAISSNLSTSVFKDLITQNQDQRPIMTMFPNGSFSKEYLQDFNRLNIEPLGLSVIINGSKAKSTSDINYSLLTDFWRHYADPARIVISAEEGLLRQTCALPYSNEAYFEGLKLMLLKKKMQTRKLSKIRTYNLMAERLYSSSGNEIEANKAWFKAWLSKD